MSRRSRSPIKLLSIPKFVTRILSSVSSPVRKHPVIPDASLEAAVKQFSNSLVNFDFDRFFTLFGPQTPVYRFIETLDFEAFRAALSKAFPVKKIESSEIQDIIDSKKSLENELVALDRMFEEMESKGLDVDSIRTSLAWVRKRNNETYPAESPESPTSEHSSHDTLSEPEDRDQWYSGQFLEIPPQNWHSNFPNADPNEVSTFTVPVPQFDPAIGWPKLESDSPQSAKAVDSGDGKAFPFPTGQGEVESAQTSSRPRSRCGSIRFRRASVSSIKQSPK